jgi:hypothetical protein
MLFDTMYHILLENENIWFSLPRKILSTETNASPNREDTDHLLIGTIDVDQISVL